MNRDCSYFEEKPCLKLSDMPRFPETNDMTKEEKFTSVTIYLSKVVDHLNGNEEMDQRIYSKPRPEVRSRMKVVNEISKLLLSSEDGLEDKAKE